MNPSSERSEAKGAALSHPAISVVMPVRNAAQYLDESIGSILGQTFTDFEFVILDDRSTDASARALHAWAQRDQRIRLYQSDRQLGLSGSSNYVVSKATAPIIARMDADDVSHRDRLRRQWEVMQERPEVPLVGTLYEGIDSRGRRVRPRDRWRATRRLAPPPFPHGSAMFRRQAFDAVGGYREACVGWEDLDLFLRMAGNGPCVVLPDALFRYRFHVNSGSLAFPIEQAKGVADLRNRCMAEHRAGRDYTHLLEAAEGGRLAPTRTIDALYRVGVARLWSGRPPAILGPLLSHGPFRLNRVALRTLILATWGSANPASLRLCLRCLIDARDKLASRRMKEGRPLEWRLE